VAKQRGCVTPENQLSTVCPVLEASGRPLSELTSVSIRVSHLLLSRTAPGRQAPLIHDQDKAPFYYEGTGRAGPNLRE
jgi:hypothetical protein